MRASGLGLSIFLIAVGAILAWAVEVDAEGVNLEMVGIILMIVGAVGAVLTLIASSTASNTVVERDREVVHSDHTHH